MTPPEIRRLWEKILGSSALENHDPGLTYKPGNMAPGAVAGAGTVDPAGRGPNDDALQTLQTLQTMASEPPDLAIGVPDDAAHASTLQPQPLDVGRDEVAAALPAAFAASRAGPGTTPEATTGPGAMNGPGGAAGGAGQPLHHPPVGVVDQLLHQPRRQAPVQREGHPVALHIANGFPQRAVGLDQMLVKLRLELTAEQGLAVDAYLYAEKVIPRHEALATEEVANVAAFLISPRSSGINAQTLIVDAGMSINYFDRSITQKVME